MDCDDSSDGKLTWLVRIVQMKVQMKAQDSLDAGSRRLKWMVRWSDGQDSSDESSEDEDSDGSV